MRRNEFKPIIIATMVMIAMLGALCIASSVPLASSAAAGTPFMVGGHVYLDTATVSGADVTVTDQNTGEGLTTTTDSNGAYVVFLGNLPSGHSAGDTLEVTATYNVTTGTSSAPRSENLSDSPQIIDVTIAVPSGGGGGGSFGSCVEVRGTIAELDASNYTIASSAGNPLYVADTCYGQPGLQWDYSSFAGFWYDLDDDLQTETLTILANERVAPMWDTLIYPYDREIGEGSLVYTTHPVYQEYELHEDLGLTVESDHPGGDCGYFIEGWMGEEYVAIDGNADELCKLLVEFEDDDMKTLTVGEEWDMGGGYSLNAKQLDLEGNKVWFVLKKDGREIDNEVASTGDIDRPQERVYTYTADLAQEYDIPVFSCYVNTIFRGADSWVEIMYVFLIDEDVLEIDTSDTYGAMEVMTASTSGVILTNDETTIDLGIDNTEHIMGNIYFKTADDDINDHIRFYPIIKCAISADDSDHDTDGDGVPDVWDVDNSTPAGYWVNSDGIGRMWGDMNGDGKLTSVDALMILQAAANGIKL